MIAGLLKEGFDAAEQVFRLQVADVEAVEVVQFGEVDGRGGGVETADVEFFHQIGEGKEFGAVVVRPAHQGGPVVDRFGEVAQFAQVGDVNGAAILHQFGGITLAHFALAAGLEEQGKMHPGGLFPPEGAVDVNVQGEGRQPFGAAQHVGDFHQVVVHHRGQVIERPAVGFDQDVIVQLVVAVGDVAADDIVAGDGAFAGHLEANDMRFPGGDAGSGLLRGDVPAMAVVARLLFAGLLFGAQFREALRGAEAGVGVAALHQSLGVLEVDFLALRLAVRAVRTAYIGAFVPFQPQPAQAVHKFLLGAILVAFAVGIFDA